MSKGVAMRRRSVLEAAHFLGRSMSKGVTMRRRSVLEAAHFLGHARGETSGNPVAIDWQSAAIPSNPALKRSNPGLRRKAGRAFYEVLNTPGRAETSLL